MQEYTNLKTLILAGGNTSIYGKNKNFVYLKGKPIVQYTLDALLKTGIREIHLVCDRKNLDSSVNGFVNVFDAKPTISANIAYSKELVSHKEEPVLLMYGDHPFATEFSIDYFLRHCDTERFDHMHAVPTKEAIELFKDFYSMGYIHAREAAFRSGNMILVKPQKLNLSLVDKIYERREQAKKINNFRLGLFIATHVIRKLGPIDTLGALYLWLHHTLMRYCYKNAPVLFEMMRDSSISSIKYLETCGAKVISNPGETPRCKAILMPFGELSMDSDKKEEYDVYNRHWDEVWNIIHEEHSKIDFGIGSKVTNLLEYKRGF